MYIQLQVFVENVDNGVQYPCCNISTTKYSYILVKHKDKDSYFTNHISSLTISVSPEHMFGFLFGRIPMTYYTKLFIRKFRTH
jgi:hypothetical protein